MKVDTKELLALIGELTVEARVLRSALAQTQAENTRMAAQIGADHGEPVAGLEYLDIEEDPSGDSGE